MTPTAMGILRACLILVLAAALLTSCDEPSATDDTLSSTTTPTVKPTLTAVPTATDTATPTATREPTSTPSPTPTATPEPTSTPSPTPTATPEPTNTPSPTTTPTPARPLVPVPTSGPVGTIRLGMPAPDFGLHFYETRAGESLPQRLSDLLGTPVVLMFWFPGCDPCMTDLQNIGSVYRGLRWGGVRFIGVQTHGFPQEGQEIVDELALSYDFVFDDHGEASRLYGVVHVPMTVVLNADHTVAGWLKGGLSLGGLRDLLESTLGSSLPPPTATPTPTDPGDTIYCEFSGLPERFFQESSVPREQVERVVSAQAWSLTKMHNGISPYSYFGYCRIEYSPEVYGHTMPYGVKLGDFAFPGLNSGHHRWEVMAHEHGHNFFGGTKPFYTDIATPAPFLQESLAVLSAFYTFHDLLENQQEYGIDDATVESLVFDFGNGRAYQEAQFKEYVDQGMKFDIHDILTSQALDFMMITYGEEYGWDKFERLTKAFEEFGVQLDHQSGEVTPVDQSTYIVAALGAAFGRDFRQDFVDLSFPIDDARYLYFLAKMSEHLGPPPPTATPETPVTESERLVSRLSAAFAEDGDLNDFEKAYLRRIGGASTPELALALSSSPLTEDTAVSELEIDILKKIERYHPRLQAAIVSHAPQGAAPFLSGSVLSDQEIEALGALHSVFGIEAFYDAWQLDWLEINEIQAVLRLLQSYDPFSTVYGPTENTDSQDGLIERTFDQFSVGPAGSCVYCQGQKYFTSGSPTKDYRSSGYSPEEYLEYSKAVTQDVVVRTRLLHLVHAATVQFRRLSPCDLRDYSKPELLVMAPNSTEFFNPLYDYYSYYGPIAYFINATTFMHSVEVNAQMLAAVAEPRWFNVDSDKGVLRLTVGDVLSPFTAATKIVAQGGPIEMSRTGCLEAAKRIVDWDRYRYTHFGGSPEQALSPFAEKVFPENPRFFPMWVMLLTNESGGQDKAQRLVGMMRSLNVPAGRLGNAVFPEVDHPDPDKGIHGGYFDDVLLPPWNVTLERNIGFGHIDKFVPIEHLFRKYDPGCRIKSDPYVAEHLRFSAAIFSCDSSVVHRPLDETFVDNLASEINRLFKSAIEAATDNNVEAAAPITVLGTQFCFKGTRQYRHPEFYGLALMKDELAELLRKEEAVLEEVREGLYRLKVDLLGRITTVSIHDSGRIDVIFSYCE